MNWMNKKAGPAAALSLLALTSVAHAAPEEVQIRNLENRVTALEQRKSGPGGMINPPARPIIKDGADVFLSGEVLVWRAREDDLTYAVKLDSLPTFDGPAHGHGMHFRGKWEPGFRIGLGYNMEHDGWDIVGYWTRFYSNQKHSDKDREQGIFEPTIYPLNHLPTTGTGIAPFSSQAQPKRWRVRLNLIDLELGREFFVSKWMTLRPHIGTRSAWVRQRMIVEYTGGNFTTVYSNFLTGANRSDVSQRCNFWGMGLRGGLDSTWGLGSGVSLYGKLAMSAVWGRFHVSQNWNVVNAGTDTEASLERLSNRFQVCRPILDLALGLRYDTTFSCDSVGMSVFAGWEHHYFWSQNKFLKNDGAFYTSMDEHDGDLSFAGFNAGVSFDF